MDPLAPPVVVPLPVDPDEMTKPNMAKNRFLQFVLTLSQWNNPALPYIALIQQPQAWYERKGFSVADAQNLAVDPPFLLGNINFPNRLYVRPCYADMVTKISDFYQNGAKSVLITGNSGVGKSMFIAYLMCALITNPNPPFIVYDDLSDDKVYLITPSTPQNINVANVIAYKDADCIFGKLKKGLPTSVQLPGPRVWPPDVLYFVEIGDDPTKKISNYGYFTIVVSSLKGQQSGVVNRLMKWGGVCMMHVPVWDWNEIDVCRRDVYPDPNEVRPPPLPPLLGITMSSVSLAVAEDRFSKWGGIPRYIFDRDTIGGTLETMFKAALTHFFRPNNFFFILTLLDDNNLLLQLGQHSSMIAHFEVAPTYIMAAGGLTFNPEAFTPVGLRLSSKKVTERGWKLFGEAYRQHYMYLMTSRCASSIINGLHPSFFEAAGHSMIAAGGTFLWRDYDEDTTAFLYRPKFVHFRRRTVVEVKTTADAANVVMGTYGKPSSQTFPSIDGLARVEDAHVKVQFFQFTTARSHGVKLDKFVLILTALGGNLDDPTYCSKLTKRIHPVFYFVVPPEKFSTFRIGSLTPTASIAQTQHIIYRVLRLYSPVAAPSDLFQQPEEKKEEKS